MDIHDLLRQSASMGASDLHMTVGIPPTSRVHGRLVRLNDERLTPADTEEFIRALLSPEQFEILRERGEVDLSVSVFGQYRYRVNAYMQRGSYAAAMRLVESKILSFAQLGLPPVIEELCWKTRGLILVTGPTGSGKSTTLAAMIDLINSERDCHIIARGPIGTCTGTSGHRQPARDRQRYRPALRASAAGGPEHHTGG